MKSISTSTLREHTGAVNPQRRSSGTLEIGGTTDRAEWVTVDAIDAAGPRTEIVDIGLAALAPG